MLSFPVMDNGYPVSDQLIQNGKGHIFTVIVTDEDRLWYSFEFNKTYSVAFSTLSGEVSV